MITALILCAIVGAALKSAGITIKTRPLEYIVILGVILALVSLQAHPI